MANVISIFGDRDPREVPLYTVGQAASYLGVPSSTVRAWSVGAPYPRAHRRTGSFKKLLDLPPGTPTRLTFNNLVEAYVLTVIRRHHGIELKYLRRAMANVTQELGIKRPLLSHRFLTDGVKLYLEEADALRDISVGEGQQYVLRQVIELALTRIEHGDRGVEKLFPYVNDPNEDRIVVIDPERAFGRPTIVGSRITTDVVADLAAAGETPERIAKEFGLTKKAVNRAVSWQRQLAA